MAERARQSRRAFPCSDVTSTPWHIILPEVGSTSRFTSLRSVDFPAPDRPMTPTKLPRTMVRLTLSTARVAPKLLETFSSRGEANGAWKHGQYSNEARAVRRECAALLRQVRE